MYVSLSVDLCPKYKLRSRLNLNGSSSQALRYLFIFYLFIFILGKTYPNSITLNANNNLPQVTANANLHHRNHRITPNNEVSA